MKAQEVRNRLCEAVGNDAWFAIPFAVRAPLVFAATELVNGGAADE